MRAFSIHSFRDFYFASPNLINYTLQFWKAILLIGLCLREPAREWTLRKGRQVERSSQPKLPSQRFPFGSASIPKPPPNTRPPVTGDLGVPFVPSAGFPLGCGR